VFDRFAVKLMGAGFILPQSACIRSDSELHVTMLTAMEPVSHFFYSDRLKLQFWDYGQEGKPALVLVHGGLDHARSWDWVAQSLCEHYHVYALDLRGHGNSAWAPGAMYTVAEHVLDLSALLDIIHEFPIRLVGHSLGGVIVLHYSGVYPDRVSKAVSIEGIGFAATHRVHGPASQRLRTWIENVRDLEKRKQHPYPSLESAISRMKQAILTCRMKSPAISRCTAPTGTRTARWCGSLTTMSARFRRWATTWMTSRNFMARSPHPR
jgi:pimeloyl-ACP methyl ester carboxylesterase